MVPKLQLRTPFDWVRVAPAESVLETKDMPGGIGSLTITLEAVEGPRLLTVMVKVTLLDTSVVVGDAD
jgi:hypothetical protein